MTVIAGDISLPGPQPAALSGVSMSLELVGVDGKRIDSWVSADGTLVAGAHTVTISASGAYSVDLVPNASITPAGTRYKRMLSVGGRASTPVYWDVPTSGGPFTELGVLDDPPAAVAPSALAAYKLAVGRITTGRPLATDLTKSLYTRTSMSGIRALAVDPSVAGRVWGTSGSNIGYMDNDGTSAFVAAVANPAAGQSVVQMTFTASFVFILTTASTDRSGQLWRGTLPAPDGTGISFASPNGIMFDLTGGTTTSGGLVDGGVNSYFRNSCFATNTAGNVGYIVEYGGVVTLGPSVYHAANLNVANVTSYLWSKRKTWANGKHGHAVAFIGGVPWVTIGDGGNDGLFSDIGVWAATNEPAGTWNRRSLYSFENNGNFLYGINMIPVTIDAQTVIVIEYDGRDSFGPLCHPSQDGTQTRTTLALCTIPPPYVGTMRQMTLTSEGNLMWVQTGESGAVGPLDSIWMARPPFVVPVLLESFAAGTLGTMGDPVESGANVFFGTYRIRKEQFIDE